MLIKHYNILKSQHLTPFEVKTLMEAPAAVGVYLIYAKEKGIHYLSYIGASKSVRGRLHQQRVLIKYRKEKISHSIHVIPVSINLLIEIETFLIKELKPSLNKIHNKR